MKENKVIFVRIPEMDKRTHKIVERKEVIFPDITDKELKERYHQIKPIVEFNSDYYKLRKFNLEELKKRSFIWFDDEDLKELVDIDNYEELDEFECFHTFGYSGLFKPSIYEVLSQYPDELLKHSNAFLLAKYPHFTSDLNDMEELDYGCHKSTVKALRLKK